MNNLDLKIESFRYLSAAFVTLMMLFCIAPFISIIFTILFIVITRSNERSHFHILFLMLALYLGVINVTKMPESDLGIYFENFCKIKDLSFISYVFFNSDGKEPLFNILNYILYYLYAGSFSLYILTLTVAIYMFQFAALYKFFRRTNNNPYGILLATCILAFFTQYFNLTAHLVRQMLAVAIMMYCIVEKVLYNKNNYILLLCSVFIHSSTLLFIPLLYIRPLRKKLSVKIAIQLIFLLIPILIFGSRISEILSRIFAFSDALSYSFNRLSENSFDEKGNISIYSLLGIVIPLLVIILYRLFFDKKTKLEEFFFYNIFIVLSLFILGANNAPLLQYRYFYIVYSFMPYIVPLLFRGNGGVLNSLNIVLLLFFILRFFIIFDDIIWRYAPIEDLLTHNFISLLTTKYW